MDDCYSVSEISGLWVKKKCSGLDDCYSVSESLVPGSGISIVVWMIATVRVNNWSLAKG